MQSTSIFPITLFVMLFRMGISLDYIFSNENLADVLTKGLTPRDMSFESSIYISVALDSLCYRLCRQLIISSKPPKKCNTASLSFSLLLNITTPSHTDHVLSCLGYGSLCSYLPLSIHQVDSFPYQVLERPTHQANENKSGRHVGMSRMNEPDYVLGIMLWFCWRLQRPLD